MTPLVCVRFTHVHMLCGQVGEQQHGATDPSYFPGALERAMASASRSMPFTPTVGRLW